MEAVSVPGAADDALLEQIRVGRVVRTVDDLDLLRKRIAELRRVERGIVDTAASRILTDQIQELEKRVLLLEAGRRQR